MICVERVYDELPARSGKRFLVERLWPRGVKKESLRLDGWLRDLAPSAELRQWFGHKPERWTEFQWRYTAELKSNSEACRALVDAARRGNVTLLYSARDRERNSARLLEKFISRLARVGAKHSASSKSESSKKGPRGRKKSAHA